ncbi:MAG: outer membrane beta-barrel protein [Paracoccaceae bacterium]
MKRICVLAVATLTASSALAGGPVYVPPLEIPMAAPTKDWTGPYVGAQLGFARGTANVATPVTGDFDGDLSGFLYGLHAGYLYDMGSLVLGGEIDYNLANIALDGAPFAVGDASATALAHAKLRVGYDATSALFYGTAGMAYMAVDPSFAADTSGTGYFAGAGVEFNVTTDWTAGLEYLYHQFEDFGDGIGDPDITLQTIQARVSYHF